MSSGSSSGYSRRIVSAVSPAASIPSTCSTAIRMSRMIGFPPKTSARTVMRSSSSVLPLTGRSIGGRHAASLSTAANSSGRDQRANVDNGSTNRKSSSVQTSAVSSNRETKVSASGPATR